ncbi:MAG: hypothetical protein Q9174_003095, partial [Haloplaca sp. 1 TL-2023]
MLCSVALHVPRLRLELNFGNIIVEAVLSVSKLGSKLLSSTMPREDAKGEAKRREDEQAKIQSKLEEMIKAQNRFITALNDDAEKTAKKSTKLEGIFEPLSADNTARYKLITAASKFRKVKNSGYDVLEQLDNSNKDKEVLKANDERLTQ